MEQKSLRNTVLDLIMVTNFAMSFYNPEQACFCSDYLNYFCIVDVQCLILVHFKNCRCKTCQTVATKITILITESFESGCLHYIPVLDGSCAVPNALQVGSRCMSILYFANLF